MKQEWEGKFFPTDLAGRQWIEFAADGFAEPVSGVIYHHGEVMPGMPLGPLVRSGPLLPSRLNIDNRKISPKASVTMAK